MPKAAPKSTGSISAISTYVLFSFRSHITRVTDPTRSYTVLRSHHGTTVHAVSIWSCCCCSWSLGWLQGARPRIHGRPTRPPSSSCRATLIADHLPSSLLRTHRPTCFPNPHVLATQPAPVVCSFSLLSKRLGVTGTVDQPDHRVVHNLLAPRATWRTLAGTLRSGWMRATR